MSLAPGGRRPRVPTTRQPVAPAPQQRSGTPRAPQRPLAAGRTPQRPLSATRATTQKSAGGTSGRAPLTPPAKRTKPSSAEGTGARPAPTSPKASGIWGSPTTSYYLLIGATVLLLALGLVMVLSASSVTSLRETEGQTTTWWFLDQVKFAFIGLFGAAILAHLPLRFLRFLTWPAMAGSLFLLALGFIPGFRVGEGGNDAWVRIAGQTVQPGEFAKLGLALWLGLTLSWFLKGEKSAKKGLWLAGVGTVAVIGSVLFTKDLGTGLIFFMLVIGALWIAGIPLLLFLIVGMLAAGVGAALVFTSSNRMARVTQFLGIGEFNADGLDLQSVRSLQGFGTGGWSGVGLGASRNKWSYLPEAHNDFIFAIIGEELGLAGSLVVLGLFLALMIGMLRVIKRHPDPFVKIATGAICAWILGQALVNIAVTLGLAPVLGVTLPLISAGGSSLISTILALGFVIGFARTEPGCIEALRSRNFRFRRSLAVLAPGRGRDK